MAELKHNFTKGRMNKDADERLVSNGEYRDAMNIEVSTSEDSDVGTIQTTLGNTLKSATGTTTAFTVGSIVDHKTNKVYWMVHNDQANITTSGITKDMIVEYNPTTETNKYVFVDIWKVVTSIGTSNGGAVKYLYIALGGSTATNNITGIRKGMQIIGTFNNIVYGANSQQNVYVEDIEFDAVDGWKIILNRTVQTVAGEQITFTTERCLNFSRNRLITGINIVDDMLFWTDGGSEPKKINIIRSIKGTGGSRTLNTNATTTFDGDNFNHHTRLVIDDIDNAPGIYEVVTNRLATYPVFCKESHLTVLRPAPQTVLQLEMSRTSYNRGNGVTGAVNRTDAQANIQFFDPLITTEPLASGSMVQVTFDQAPDYRVGDYIIITNDTTVLPTDYKDYKVRCKISQIPTGHTNNNLMFGIFELEIITISQELVYNASGEQFFTLLEQKDSVFEFKFPKFSYRYKYTDGEYSAFAPWSEIAFLAGSFDYEPKHGHNLGMTNRLKSLCLKNYVPEPGEIGASRPGDVIAIDILYKESNNTNIYTVKTITSNDNHPVWPDLATRAYARGELIIDTEMIHAVLPSDQFLRPFDIVPRKAKSQEVTGNRLVYGNYTQNYNVDEIINIETTLQVGSFSTHSDTGEKSVKSLRDYQVGVVYLDKYGRETPVLVGPEKGFKRVGKVFSDNFTKLRARLTNTPPSWAKGFKFYVKEPSNEYYNLAMDRWYNAKDGNIWISFPSSERNKIDEDTFLILKKSHAKNKSVSDDEARYKILAIESEAPEFIKKVRKNLGEMFDNSAREHVGNGGDGFPFPGFNYVEVPYAALNNSSIVDIDASGTVNPKSPHLQDNLFLRVGGPDNLSAEYEIVGISNTGQGGNYKFRLNKRLGDDLEFTSTDGTYGNRISGLFIQLIQYRIENKAEFDGRFFVKINQDQVIRTNVIGDKINSEDMIVYSARHLRYVKSKATHPNHAGMPNSNQWHGTNNFNRAWGGIGGVSDHEDIHKKLDVNGYSYWKGFIKFNRNGNGSKFFIDEDSIVTIGPDGSPVSSNLATGDMATKAYCFPNITNSDSLTKHDGQKNTGYGGNSAKYPKGVHQGANEPVGSRIDISWVGYEDTNYPQNSPPVFWSQHGQDIAPDDYEFSKEWFQIGTKFRFAGDDDETVYTVKDYRHEFGLRNFQTVNGNVTSSNRNKGSVYRDKWTLQVEPPIVRTASGFYPTDIRHDGTQNQLVELVRTHSEYGVTQFTDNPGIFETEPKKDVGLDVYYEASVTYPTQITSDTNEMFAPIGSTVSVLPSAGATVSAGCKVFSWSDNTVTLDGSVTDPNQGEILVFTRPDGGTVQAKVEAISASTQGGGITVATGLTMYRDVSNQRFTLGYTNCFAFPQGVESDRIRDDFNQITIGKGTKASTVLAEQFNEEHRKSGLIFSGIYNSMTGVNNLNQFIASSGITKDLNNQYGSIQKLFTRDNNIVAFCEDKILKVYANKDALFNADGSSNVVATNRFLGDSQPFGGDFGISKNPESFAQENFRIYFTDKSRGAVLRLSKDGLTVISNQGMADYFRDHLPLASDLIGSYDKRKGLYNLTLHDKGVNPDGRGIGAGITYVPKVNTTISFSEKSSGWTSFKSFVQESGVSLDNNYYTFKKGEIFLHHSNQETNNYYDTIADVTNGAFSSVTVMLNDLPGSVKSFNTLNYEGTQSQIDLFQTITIGGVVYNDGEFYNLKPKKGWFVESMITDLQTARLKEFIEKEGKWFNYLYGETTTLANLDSREFSYQGIGMAESITHNGPTPIYGCTDSTALNYNPAATIDDGSCLYINNPIQTNAYLWNNILQPCKGSCLPNFTTAADYEFTHTITVNPSLPANTTATVGIISVQPFQQLNGCAGTQTIDGAAPDNTTINPVYTIAFTADTGFKFTGVPSATITINDASTSITDYTITQTALVYDANSNLTGATFEVAFVTPGAAMTVRDDIKWNVCTTQIPTINNSTYTLTVQDDPNDH
jgi:hypothetical protein